jgi:hypothetical protein
LKSDFAFCTLQFVFCTDVLWLPPNANRHVRTDFSADGASRASPGIFPNGKEISLTVDFLTHSQEFFRAGNGAQPATFTPFSIDLNL